MKQRLKDMEDRPRSFKTHLLGPLKQIREREW